MDDVGIAGQSCVGEPGGVQIIADAFVRHRLPLRPEIGDRRGLHVPGAVGLHQRDGLALVGQGRFVVSERAFAAGAVGVREVEAGLERDGRRGGPESAIEIALLLQGQGQAGAGPDAVRQVARLRQRL